MLKTVQITAGGGGNGTVTNVATGTGLTGGPITTTGTIALANTAVTAATYGTASSVSQVTIDAQGRITSASNVAIAIANTAVSGLGTMSIQNANAVAITGGNVTSDVITASTKFVGANYDASGSGGGSLRTSGGSAVLQWGGGGGVNLTLDGAFNMNPANYSISLAPTGTGTVTVNPATTGTINNVIIGGTTAAAGTFTNLTSANVSITGGTINVQSTNLVSTTSASATFATASLPLVPAGYIQVDLNGTVVKVPYYAA
jgi:hypothetical protein